MRQSPTRPAGDAEPLYTVAQAERALRQLSPVEYEAELKPHPSLRCRYRDSWEQPSLMEPGRVYEIAVGAFATCNLFKRGHRIRLDLSSSNFPKYDVNPNTGEPEGRATLRRVATNTVHMSRSRPSRVELSIVPIGALRYL